MNYNEMSKEKQITIQIDEYQYKKELSIEEQLEMVKEDGHAIGYIKNPSLEVQLAAVRENGYAICDIDNPALEVQLEAVKEDGYSIRLINNPSLEVQLAAVSEDGTSIRYINNPSQEVKFNAVKQNIKSLYDIDNLELFKDNEYEYRHIKDHKEYRLYICKRRYLFVDLSNKDDIRYTIGCQNRLTKDEFINRIYNDCPVKGKGLKWYQYRQEYLDIINSIEI